MYKALIFDIDGTVVPVASNGTEVTEAVRKQLHAIALGGVHITCATGREWELARPVIQALNLQSLCVVEGGTRIVDATTEQTVWEQIMDVVAIERVKQVFDSLYDEGLLMHSQDLTRVPTKDVPAVPESVRFMYLLKVPDQIAEEIQNEINSDDCHAVAHITPSWEGKGFVDVHVTHTEGAKEHAINVWQQMVGVLVTETIGMGDSGNDLPLFNAAGLKVAVGNATPGLKELADYIAPDVYDGSLGHVLEKFF